MRSPELSAAAMFFGGVVLVIMSVETFVVAVFFYRGRIKRPEGVILLGIYTAYWMANFS